MVWARWQLRQADAELAGCVCAEAGRIIATNGIAENKRLRWTARNEHTAPGAEAQRAFGDLMARLKPCPSLFFFGREFASRLLRMNNGALTLLQFEAAQALAAGLFFASGLGIRFGQRDVGLEIVGIALLFFF